MKEFQKILETNERILNNIGKDWESKPRVKYKGHNKGNKDQNKVKTKQDSKSSFIQAQNKSVLTKLKNSGRYLK